MRCRLVEGSCPIPFEICRDRMMFNTIISAITEAFAVSGQSLSIRRCLPLVVTFEVVAFTPHALTVTDTGESYVAV
jgi:hypothetical protein